MKRIALTLLALVVLFSAFFPCSAFAEAPDLSDMTDEELHALIDAARNELTSREMKAAENTVLFEQEGVQVYMTGNNRTENYGDSAYLYVEVIIINDSDKDIALVDKSVCVNGWEVMFFGVGGVSAGKKKKDEIELVISDASISSLEEVEDVEFVFQLVDENAYNIICTADPVTVHFDQ